MLLDATRAQLLIVDVQERLLPAMHDPETVTAGCARLLRAAAVLEVPVLVSEQYPKGLGPTVPEVAELIPSGAVMDKVHFSCTGDAAIMDRLKRNDRSQVVIAGIEAHVCVLQTALTLQQRGFEPFVVMDAVSSRRPESVALAQTRLAEGGVDLVNGEMVLFEWLGQAGTPAFKSLSPLLK
ncbi:MAG TPA: hydrolase [Alphaproteobacteria bacterium]|jgi:nicotinamidase-related amidase|nr:hydrolase [Alphaproteobacteria bacterium]